MTNGKSLPKKQHHVWQAYLRAWTINGRLWCYMPRLDRFFPSNTKDVANDKFFYEFEELNQKELFIIKGMIEKTDDLELQKINKKLVAITQAPFIAKTRASALNLNEAEQKEMLGFMNDHAKTGGESLHGRIENGGKPFLDALRVCDISFYEDPRKCGEFLYFVCHQYCRTVRIRRETEEYIHSLIGEDSHALANVMQFVMANNISSSLFKDRKNYTITLLHNMTQVPFITGDQPIINMIDHKKSHDMEFFYPLTPNLAILFGPKKREPNRMRDLWPNDVELYNAALFAECRDQVLSGNENYLREFAEKHKTVKANTR